MLFPSPFKHFPRQLQELPSINTKPLVGPIFIGACLTWMLLGTLVVQVYQPLTDGFIEIGTPAVFLTTVQFSRPSEFYGLLLIDFVQTIISTWAAWDLVIERWGDIGVIVTPPKSVVAVPIFSAVVGEIVQTFYAWRIWTLGRHKYLKLTSVAIVAVAITQSVACIVNSIRFAIIDETARLPSLRAGFTVWLTGSFVCDILIAVSMLFILNKAKTRSRSLSISLSTFPNATTGQRSHGNNMPIPSSLTQTLLDRLIRQTVETGAVTAVCAGVELVLFLRLDMQFQHIAPAYVLGKLYTNCLMATLNSRRTQDSSEYSSSTSQLNTGSRSKHSRPRSRAERTAIAYRMNVIEPLDNDHLDAYERTPVESDGQNDVPHVGRLGNLGPASDDPEDHNGYGKAKNYALRIEISTETETVVDVNDEDGFDHRDVKANDSGTDGRISSDVDSYLSRKGGLSCNK